jgi:pimeloyl-ACP methyl ester carboxylesterase
MDPAASSNPVARVTTSGQGGSSGMPSPPAQAPDEIRALNRLAFEEVGRFISGIGGFQRGPAERAFRAVGWGAKPTERIYTKVTNAVYAGLRGATAAVGSAADRALGRRPIDQGRRLSANPAGSFAIAVLDGLIGDALEEQQSALAEPMSVRVDGRVVEPEPDALAQAFPQATPRLVVFVHGLMGTELGWKWFGGPAKESYGDRLVEDLAVTPVFIRYNTGRHISQNGRSLCELLEQVVGAWPVDVEQIALVGHSMGGLVSRSAAYCGVEDGAEWVRRVRHVVSLGTPHMGAPMAQAVHYATAGLCALPETRPLGDFLRRRSGGIRDLHQGSLVDEDWRDCDPDALRVAACREVPLLDGATHHFVAATVTRSAKHPLGRLVGDWLVLEPSASGRSRSRRIPFRVEDGMHLGATNHIALLNHPAVYERLRQWLAKPPALAALPAAT